MSAIGDYIHFGRIGYNKHGITRNGKREQADFNKQKNLMRNRAKMLISGIDTKAKEKYEDQLNNIFSIYAEDDDSMYKKAQDIIKDKLDKDFLDTLGNINWETGDVSKISSAKNSLSKIQIHSNQKEVYLSTIMKRIQSLETIKNNMRNVKKQEDLENRINNIYNELSKIVEYTEKELRDFNELKEIPKMKLIVDSWKEGKESLGYQTYNVTRLINQAISALSPPTYLQKGNLFEYAGALAAVMAKGIAQDEIEEELTKALSNVQGDNRSRTEIDFDKFFMDGVAEHMYMNKWEMQLDRGAAVSFMPSQEKIDIKVELGNKLVGISAKNYNFNLGYNLGLVSGTSLLYLIQDENPNFVNHYLNLVAQHPKSSVALNANFNAAHEAMKFTILYKAFTGDTYKREKASLFLVNDNSKPGGIKLYEMADLIDKAYNNMEAYTIFRNLPGYESIKNRWRNTPEERIATFLSEIHKCKISVSLNPSILK